MGSASVGKPVPPQLRGHTFRPGHDPRRNIGGRPRGASPLAALLRELAKDPDGEGMGRGARDTARVILDVMGGRLEPEEAAVRLKAAALIMDRVDPPTKRIESVTRQEVTVVLQEFLVVVQELAPDRYDAILDACRARIPALKQSEE